MKRADRDDTKYEVLHSCLGSCQEEKVSVNSLFLLLLLTVGQVVRGEEPPCCRESAGCCCLVAVCLTWSWERQTSKLLGWAGAGGAAASAGVLLGDTPQPTEREAVLSSTGSPEGCWLEGSFLAGVCCFSQAGEAPCKENMFPMVTCRTVVFQWLV